MCQKNRKSRSTWILIGLVAGIAFGVVFPAPARQLGLLGAIFLRLIRDHLNRYARADCSGRMHRGLDSADYRASNTALVPASPTSRDSSIALEPPTYTEPEEVQPRFGVAFFGGELLTRTIRCRGRVGVGRGVQIRECGCAPIDALRQFLTKRA